MIVLTSNNDVDRASLNCLTYREREIIKLRHRLGGDGYTYTLDEVRRIFKISSIAQVRRIEANAVRKLNDRGFTFVEK